MVLEQNHAAFWYNPKLGKTFISVGFLLWDFGIDESKNFLPGKFACASVE